MADDLAKQVMPIFCGLLPDGGPRAYRRDFDFTNTGEHIFDLYKEDADGDMKMVQSVFIENPGAAKVTILQEDGPRFSLQVPAKSQGVYPMLATKNPKFKIRTTQAAVVVIIHFLNVPMPYASWLLP